MQNRLNSKVMWLGIASGIGLVYNSIATQFGYPLIANETINILINTIFGIISVISSINNPTNKDNI